MARSDGIPPRLRNDGRPAALTSSAHHLLTALESWVEISSQPSSSSLSSIGDEIVTTGLRVQQDSNTRRRRRVQPGAPSHLNLEARQTSTSSQEEYEESESEEDHIMTSSNEHIIPASRLSTVSRPEYDAGSDSDDDDENATALGRRTDERIFTPQPNAFSHPPSSQRAVGPGSYFPPHGNTRQSYPPRTTSRQHSYNHQADHDAALRASLTTLLSIGAAAARGLPKRDQGSNTVTSNEPMGLRIVPESELAGPVLPTAANISRPLSPSTRARSSPSISSQEAAEKGKRKATGTKQTLEKTRATKKKRTQVEEEALISPTFLTWVMSAGVLVLVSVVGFGAGYVIGREVGRQEVLTGLNSSTFVDGGSCGREVARAGTGSGTLRKFKWGIGSAARGIVA
jgi:hypothetical protein